MIRPLVISRSYLWDRSTTGQIQRVFWEDLCNRGFEPTIICSGNNQGIVPLTELKSKILQPKDSKLIRYAVKALGKRIVPDIMLRPDDAWYSWCKLAALKCVRKEAISGKYDFIQSVSHPESSHLMAIEAKRASGLPWIAYFYDPWLDNPFRQHKGEGAYQRDRRQEALVADYADAILHISQPIYNEWVERYGESIKDKMFMLPTVFDVGNAGEVNGGRADKTKFVISHIGALYAIRNSVDFIKALHLMLEGHPELKDRIVVNYVGSITDEDEQAVKDYDLQEIVNFVGFLSEEECKKYYEMSDLFLSIDAKSSRNIFFPSKIMKYFYYGKPILGLTSKGSALQYELEKSNNFFYDNEDYLGIADFLFRAITTAAFTSGIDRDYWKNFTMERVFPQYIKIVNKIL